MKEDLEEPIVLKLKGKSMSPLLNQGDILLAKKTDQIKLGDVAIIDSGGLLLIHKIVDIVLMGKKRWYIHKGEKGSSFGITQDQQIIAKVKTLPWRKEGPFNVFTILLKLGAVLYLMGIPLSRIFPLAKRGYLLLIRVGGLFSKGGHKKQYS
jgi:signal peptidase I